MVPKRTWRESVTRAATYSVSCRTPNAMSCPRSIRAGRAKDSRPRVRDCGSFGMRFCILRSDQELQIAKCKLQNANLQEMMDEVLHLPSAFCNLHFAICI